MLDTSVGNTHSLVCTVLHGGNVPADLVMYLSFCFLALSCLTQHSLTSAVVVLLALGGGDCSVLERSVVKLGVCLTGNRC